MSNYVLLSDSTTDLPKGMAASIGVDIIPLTYIMDGVGYIDVWGGVSENGSVSPTEKGFYDLLRQGKTSSTSQITEAAFAEFFEPYLKNGKDIIYVCFTSGLSGTFGQSQAAAAKLSAKYPERKITTIDSLCACMGEGLLVWLAAKRKNDGADYAELVQYIKDTRLKINHWVTLDDLTYLKRGGRLSATAAFMGGLLNLKPIIHVDDDGHLTAVKKVRGHKKSLETIIGEVEARAANPKDGVFFISHSDCPEVVDEIVAMLKERFGTHDITTSYIGPVIGSHTGPGTVAVFFLEN